ncbi:MAG: alternative ribosome rescue aminoacyl-tRNA hydrolase ArfB [Gemmataceae bacterium]
MQITERYELPDDELEWSYARSGGPGGQNVNKVSSKAVLRWAMGKNTTVPVWVRERLKKLFPARVTTEGDVLIASQEHRDQERNRQSCVEKLAEMLAAAETLPKPRMATKPTKGSKKRRLEDKKRQADRRSDRQVGE